jgi:hypothetical protein
MADIQFSAQQIFNSMSKYTTMTLSVLFYFILNMFTEQWGGMKIQVKYPLILCPHGG